MHQVDDWKIKGIYLADYSYLTIILINKIQNVKNASLKQLKNLLSINISDFYIHCIDALDNKKLRLNFPIF